MTTQNNHKSLETILNTVPDECQENVRNLLLFSQKQPPTTKEHHFLTKET